MRLYQPSGYELGLVTASTTEAITQLRSSGTTTALLDRYRTRRMVMSGAARPTTVSERLLRPTPAGRHIGTAKAKRVTVTQQHTCLLSALFTRRFQLSAFKEEVGRACQQAVSELMLEFDTGGNVRFEEGRPVDVWFSSCVDLVKSRVVSTAILHCIEQ